jgi:hypothetical protein
VTAAPEPTLQELRRYTYEYTFDVRRAAQDTVTASQAQNVAQPDPAVDHAPAAVASVDAAPGAGLGGSLAWFTTIHDHLEQDLALIPTLGVVPPRADPQGPALAAQRALRAFGLVAIQAAADWGAWVTPPAAAPQPPQPSAASAAALLGSVPSQETRFELRRRALPTGEASVRLLPCGPASPLVAPATTADAVEIGLPGHVSLTGHGRAVREPITFARFGRSVLDPPVPADGDSVPMPTRQPLPGVDEFVLSVADRDVISAQNIWGRVDLSRNAHLLAGTGTNGAFLYTVPEARMPAPGTPLITYTDALDVTAVPVDPVGAPPSTGSTATGRRPLVDWLINFFDSLLNRYAVLGGDSLATIASRHGLAVSDLVPAVTDVARLLVPKTVLLLPVGSHPVAVGDTVGSIARAHSLAPSTVAGAFADDVHALTPGVLLRPGGNARTIRVAADFGFRLASAAAPGDGQQREIVSRLPVLLRPSFLFDSAADLRPAAGFCADLAAELTSWATARGVPDGAGMWVFDISLYTTLPSATAPSGPVPDVGAVALSTNAPPLLQLSDVRLPRDRIGSPGASAPSSGPTRGALP